MSIIRDKECKKQLAHWYHFPFSSIRGIEWVGGGGGGSEVRRVAWVARMDNHLTPTNVAWVELGWRTMCNLSLLFLAAFSKSCQKCSSSRKLVILLLVSKCCFRARVIVSVVCSIALSKGIKPFTWDLTRLSWYPKFSDYSHWSSFPLIVNSVFTNISCLVGVASIQRIPTQSVLRSESWRRETLISVEEWMS